MGVITPTLSITSNAEDFATAEEQGPSSIALALSVTDTLTVDTASVNTITFTGDGNHQRLYDGDAADMDDGSGVAGLNGAFLYMKNNSTTDLDIYIGIKADGGSAAALEANNEPQRLFTLKQGEFAFFPYDYTMDIDADGEGANAVLEYWLFNRANA